MEIFNQIYFTLQNVSRQVTDDHRIIVVYFQARYNLKQINPLMPRRTIVTICPSLTEISISFQEGIIKKILISSASMSR